MTATDLEREGVPRDDEAFDGKAFDSKTVEVEPHTLLDRNTRPDRPVSLSGTCVY